ncbi:hypothetical protein D9M71_341270 [compost metagenome]
MIGGLPDIQHGLVFLGMQRVGSQPLLKRLALGCCAVLSLQTQAPMRGGIGDGIVFVGAVAGVVHRGSRFCLFYPCSVGGENPG